MELVIIGTGGMGREALWIAQASKSASPETTIQIAGFVTSDTNWHGKDIHGVPVLGDESCLFGRDDIRAVCAIGNPRDRMRVTQRLAERGVRFASLCHPSAVVAGSAVIGEGCIIGANASISTDVVVGNHVIVNMNASVSHDSRLGDYATLAPGSRLAGGVTLGVAADLGTNSCVIPEQKVGRGTVVGAGTVVINGIGENCVAVGVPARVIRQLTAEERL